MTELTAKGLSVEMAGAQLVAPLDIAFETQSLTAVIGPNGAGKTSLIRALLGLVRHEGSVRFGDRDRDTLSPSQRARFASYLPQGQSHAWPLTVSDVVALGRHPHGGVGDFDSAALLERLGLTALARRSVLSLSGGEQMRVALARALAVEAQFLLADEPLASLDPRYQFAILDALAAEVRSGVGAVVVLHDLRLAAQRADRMVLIKDGAILADGTPSDVLSKDLIEAAFEVTTGPQMVPRADGAITVALPVESATITGA